MFLTVYARKVACTFSATCRRRRKAGKLPEMPDLLSSMSVLEHTAVILGRVDGRVGEFHGRVRSRCVGCNEK